MHWQARSCFKKMKKKLDFIIESDGCERTVFRFYPRSSRVHGFDETCPTSWDAVYKVYYTWAIIRQYRWSEGNNWGDTEILFDMYRDECSALTYLADEIRALPLDEDVSVPSFGDSLWDIKFSSGDREKKIHSYFKFAVWNRGTGQGYRFYLSRKNTRKFVKYLDYVQQYMLEHSVPI